MITTLLGPSICTLGKIKEKLKENFPTAVDWAREDEWYSVMLRSLQKAFERSKLQEADTSAAAKTIPIYRRNNASKKGNDLEGIILQLLKSNKTTSFREGC